ncbi:hypothetical protein BKA61DRAFT_672983 [Leptodontidium sp. MPI-SDFR-AT-0119]|nr:hypothetical protein BKA61DRAFT_672983 [Leptodontidium sp. MPI-SDFR-AT-0119]
MTRSELVKEKLIPSSWMDDVADNTVYRLKRDVVRAAKAKLSSHVRYVADDEILDRLAFLAWPLGLEDRVSSDFCPATLASITAKRIKERDFTREISLGTTTAVGDPGSTCGPWEIHALCHHSRLMVANYLYKRRDGRSRGEKMEEVDKYRQKLCDFITAESSVVPCWERKNLATRRGWLRSEATSVLGSTLLEICQKDFELLQEELLREGTLQQELMQKKPLLLSQLLEDKSPPAIDWKKYCPPNRYHPEDFFNSLEDTPDIYRYNRIQRTEIPPSLRMHLSLDDLPDDGDVGVALTHLLRWPQFSSQSVHTAIASSSISIIDLTAQKSEQLESVSRKSAHQYRVCTTGAVRIYASESWCRTLQGPVRPGNVVRKPPRMEEEEKRVVDRLSDSLVDKGVQHRILAVKSSGEKSLVAHFVYVFHAESAAAFSDNICKISAFSCKNRGTEALPGNLSILPPKPDKSEVSPEDAPIMLPIHLHEPLRKLHKKVYGLEDEAPGNIRLSASSIVLSTNKFGDFSKCSIISEMITEETLQQLEKEVPILWQRFIHQPQTGRCLVFLLLLGRLCQAIALEHQEAVNYLMAIINIEDSFLRGKQDWLTDQNAIGKLQLALWSLESLYKLRNTLAGSLATINEAKNVLFSQIKEGPGNRSAALESQCQYSLESSECNLGQLTALYIKIDRKTELGSRYRDSVNFPLTPAP